MSATHQTSEPLLCVKELSAALGKSSAGYVYKMRMAGFAMGWDGGAHCFVARVSEARRWIERNGFTVRQGWPVLRRQGEGTGRIEDGG